MPTLPDKTALGSPENPGARPVVPFPANPSMAMTGSEQLGQGFANIGGAVAKIGAEQQEQDDSLDLIKADAVHTQGLTQTKRAFDTDTEYPTFAPRFDQAANQITADAAGNIRNPELRQKWLIKAATQNIQTKDQILGRGQALASQDKFDDVDDALKNYSAAYADPANDDNSRARILRDMHSAVDIGEKSGLLDPQKARWLRENRIDGALASDGEQRVWTDPEGLLADLQGGSRYAQLSPQKRHALITNAKVALRETDSQEVRDDIEKLRAGADVTPGPDGLTSFERARRSLTPHQYQAALYAKDEAVEENRAIAPLSSMSEGEAVQHLDSLKPNEASDDVGYKMQVSVRDKAAKAWSRIENQRRDDPAMAVDSAPEVQQASQLVKNTMQGFDGSDPQATQKANVILLEARLAAQKRLGIIGAKSVSKRDADNLLQLPPGQATDEDLTDAYKAAAERVESAYGPKYAPQVFKDAVYLHSKAKHDREAAADMIAQLAAGANPQDVKPKQSAGWFDSWFGAPAAAGPEGAEPEQPDTTNPAPPRAQVFPTANDRQFEWANQDPAARQSVYDAKFGPGAFARDTAARAGKK